MKFLLRGAPRPVSSYGLDLTFQPLAPGEKARVECRPNIHVYLPMVGTILVELLILHHGQSEEYPKSIPSTLRIGPNRQKIGPDPIELPTSERLSLHFCCQGPPGSPEAVSVELGPVPADFDLQRQAGSRESYWSQR